MSKICLFIWRFQPAHNGTVDAIQQIIDAWYDEILFGVGSGDKEYTPENPLTYQERKAMLEAMMAETFPQIKVTCATIPDFGDNDAWLNFILTNLPTFQAIASGNARTQDIFLARGYSIVDLKIRKMSKASNIRKFIKENNRDALTDLTPSSVIEILKKYDLTQRLRTICPPEKKQLIVKISVKHGDEEKTIALDPDKSITEHIDSLYGTDHGEVLARWVDEHIDEFEHTLTLHYSL